LEQFEEGEGMTLQVDHSDGVKSLAAVQSTHRRGGGGGPIQMVSSASAAASCLHKLEVRIVSKVCHHIRRQHDMCSSLLPTSKLGLLYSTHALVI
jgi:hypothetical protein